MLICGGLPEDGLSLGVDISCLHSAEGAARGVPTLCPSHTLWCDTVV